MLASLSLLESFVKRMRRDMVHTVLALLPAPDPRAISMEEQRELEAWLFDRDERWTR